MACRPHLAGEFTGKIAIVQRGSCFFVTKFLNAQAAGAVGIIVVNHASTEPVFMAINSPSVNIPGISIGKDVGLPLLNEISINKAQYHVTFVGSSRCYDPTYGQTQGTIPYARRLTYVRSTDAITPDVSSLKFDGGL